MCPHIPSLGEMEFWSNSLILKEDFESQKALPARFFIELFWWISAMMIFNAPILRAEERIMTGRAVVSEDARKAWF